MGRTQEPESGYTIIVVPADAEGTRTFRVTARAIRVGAVVATVAGVVLAVILGTWWYFAAQAARVPDLERDIAELQAENRQVNQLAAALEQLQAEYAKVRRILGADAQAVNPRSERIPAEAAEVASDGGPRTGLAPEIPTSWPLTTAGFVTQPHQSEQPDGGRHPGLDIAVAQDSYIRASGAGVVLEADTDSVYGHYVLIEHGNTGYRSMYGHNSRLFVSRGDTVRQNQVIALSGNTGRSTAPHLHFEILRDGRPVDPLTLVQQRTSS